jgi:RNA polymerase sigma factor (sigma-70 family)
MKQSTERQQDTYGRCLAAVEECNATLRWGLEPAACQRYADAITPCLAAAATADQIHDVVANYHADHQAVAALRDARQSGHEQAWREWMHQALLILRRAGLAWSSDQAIDSDDLAQIARAELVRALPSYRYQSRLYIWANRVVVQIARRHLRDSRRSKRAARPDSLDQLVEIEEAPPDAAHDTEAIVHTRQLYSLIMTILAEQADQRLGYLFHLWAVEDRRSAEIGALVQLHPSRVRALLQQIRQLLRDHPAIRAWQEGERVR